MKLIKNINIKSIFVIAFLFSAVGVWSQVQFDVDTTSVKIGDQIMYKISAVADSTDLVVFPEGQTFQPLEMVEALPDSLYKREGKLHLEKYYALTQFDSGVYTIPKQKVLINDKPFFTDSLVVNFNNVAIDTTKQKIFSIKPVVKVAEVKTNYLKPILISLLILVVIAGIVYWFFIREKELTEEEKIALLPPYERAKVVLEKLDEEFLKEHSAKEYYTELTQVLKLYLDEKVFEGALESTTDELILKLKAITKTEDLDVDKELIQELELILKRADLVKFAKYEEDAFTLKKDKSLISSHIDSIKEGLNEIPEEELEEQEQQKELKEKRKWITIGVTSFMVFLMFIFLYFGFKNGFGYTKDKALFNSSLAKLEKEFVHSEYGFPPIQISTPKPLLRQPAVKDSLGNSDKSIVIFNTEDFDAVCYTTIIVKKISNDGQNKEDKISEQEFLSASNSVISSFEQQGAKDIVVKNEKFVTPNASEGMKTFGTFNIEGENQTQYQIIQFRTKELAYLVVVKNDAEDKYATQIADKIVSSIDFKKEAK